MNTGKRNLPRMRSIKEIVDYFKETDPETQISEHFVRTVIADGFPIVKTGKKFLINLDLFIDYLYGEYQIDNKEE